MSNTVEFPFGVGDNLPDKTLSKHHDLFFKRQKDDYVLYIFFHDDWIIMDNLVRLLRA